MRELNLREVEIVSGGYYDSEGMASTGSIDTSPYSPTVSSGITIDAANILQSNSPLSNITEYVFLTDAPYQSGNSYLYGGYDSTDDQFSTTGISDDPFFNSTMDLYPELDFQYQYETYQANAPQYDLHTTDLELKAALDQKNFCKTNPAISQILTSADFKNIEGTLISKQNGNNSEWGTIHYDTALIGQWYQSPFSSNHHDDVVFSDFRSSIAASILGANLLIHTHPEDSGPGLSKADMDLSREYGVPIVAITQNSNGTQTLYCYSPGTH